MPAPTTRGVELPSGDTMPALGMGTWRFAAGRHAPEVEIDALRTGLESA
jgi:diketogulonate reductase-like aldo/keto reductase